MLINFLNRFSFCLEQFQVAVNVHQNHYDYVGQKTPSHAYQAFPWIVEIYRENLEKPEFKANNTVGSRACRLREHLRRKNIERHWRVETSGCYENVTQRY